MLGGGIQLCDCRFLVLPLRAQGIPSALFAHTMSAMPCRCLRCTKMSKNGIWTPMIAPINLISRVQEFRYADSGTCNAPYMWALATQELAQYSQRNLQSYMPHPEVDADFRPPSLPCLPERWQGGSLQGRVTSAMDPRTPNPGEPCQSVPFLSSRSMI